LVHGLVNASQQGVQIAILNAEIYLWNVRKEIEESERYLGLHERLGGVRYRNCRVGEMRGKVV
jgi:hypothetical protein